MPSTWTCTTDDIVSSAECSSDDEDLIECEPSTGKSGQSCFACFLISFAKNNTYVYIYVCVCYIKYKFIQPSIRSHGVANNKRQRCNNLSINGKLFSQEAKLPGTSP
uniref:Uncharacterized protein n=1 Tax=Terrapene triunguis TaxID=2587831 RepID=A0A674IMX1_9SAUR